MILITHNAHHAYLVGDRFTVLERGRGTGTVTRADTTIDELENKMAGGRELERLSRRVQTGAGRRRFGPMTVRIGLLGCGRIGRMHAELLSSRVPEAELTLVCDVLPEAAKELGNHLGVNVAPSIDDVFAGGAVDAVAICTNTDTHAELITRAATAGLPAFCEKPISLALDTVDETLAVVDDAGTLLQIGFNRRFDPAHQAVRDAVAGGASETSTSSRSPAATVNARRSRISSGPGGCSST